MCRQSSIEIGQCRHSPLRGRGTQRAAIGDTPIDGFFPGIRVALRQRIRPGIESQEFLFSEFDSGPAHDCSPLGYFNHPLFAGLTARRDFQHPYAALSVRHAVMSLSVPHSSTVSETKNRTKHATNAIGTTGAILATLAATAAAMALDPNTVASKVTGKSRNIFRLLVVLL